MEKWWQLNKILWKQYLVRNKIWLAVLCVVGILAICFGTKSGTEEYNGIKVGVDITIHGIGAVRYTDMLVMAALVDSTLMEQTLDLHIVIMVWALLQEVIIG